MAKLDGAYDRTEFIFNEVARAAENKEEDVTLIKKILEGRDLKGKSVLEAGCGFGDNLLYCVRNGAGYAEGFDISAESIKLAQSKARDLPNVKFHKSNIEEFETSRRFDIVLAIGVFEYFEDPFKALDKIASMVSSGGEVILLISKPILIKRISFLVRAVLSRIPHKMVASVASFIDNIFNKCSLLFKKRLSTSTSSTYTMKRVILEGLMVNRYNVIDPRKFRERLRGLSFDVFELGGISPSMACIIGKRKD